MKNSNEHPAPKSLQANALAPDTAVPVTLNPRFMVPRQEGNRPRTPDDFNSVPFANLPLYIPNINTPHVGFDGAINKAAVEVHKEKGLLLLLLPYLDMDEFDLLRLFFKDPDNPVATYTVSQDDIDNDRLLPMYVPPGRLVDGPANPVFIEVTRAGGGTAETQRLNLIIDTALPAGINPVASTLQNENLHKPIFPQDLIDFGVGQDDIGTPIPVTIKYYPVNTSQPATTYRKVRDRIRLSIGGKIVEHRVTEGEAAGTADIVIMVNTSVWTAIGTGSHVCEYEVVDEAGNHSDGWSPAQILDVQLDDGSEPLLPIAFIQEAPDNILNHDTLIGDAHAFIFINGNGYQPGDIIRVIVNGRTVDGEPLITTCDSPPLTSTTAFYITVAVPNADVKALIGGRFQLRYKRIRSGVPDRNSRSNIIDVIGTELPVGLQPPYFIEAIDKVLNPQELFFNGIFPGYAGQNYFDLVTLILLGNYANGNSFYREYDNIAGDGDVLFFIPNGPNGDIAKLEGGTLEIYCLVENEHGLRPSQSTLYNVGQPMASLREPHVLEAPEPGYQFDPAVSLGNANVRVLPDTDIKDGDTVKLYALGNASGGTPIVPPFPITSFWEGRTLPFTLPRANVIRNTAMRIYYTRERLNAQTRYSHQVDMKIGSAPDLRVPNILESTLLTPSTATMNPLNVLNPPVMTLRVTYTPMLNNDWIKPRFLGKAGLGSPEIAGKQGNASLGYVDFQLPNTAAAANLGLQVKVDYQITQNTNIYSSEILYLTVEPLPESSTKLVIVPEAVEKMIDTLLNNSVNIINYPFMKSGQAVWVKSDGSSDRTLRNGTAVSPEEFNAKQINTPIPSEYLLSLTDGSALKIDVWVSLDGTNNFATAYKLASSPEYIVINKTLTTFTENFTGRPITVITPGSKYTIPGVMEIFHKGGTINSRISDTEGNIVPGMSEGMVYWTSSSYDGVPALSLQQITPAVAVRRVKFACCYQYELCQISFFTITGKLLHTIEYPKVTTGGERHHTVEFQTHFAEKIHHIDIKAYDNVLLDFFVFGI
ncbi:hypothetical protein [Pseudomonas sp. DR208]|uniref:hypothetical protein n=1 Tax=Pseudomonas sp. DR208 TaxID=2870840 RepID=UPI001C99967F|nr:hypothetical protein [Pseudomonas sp. DR208]QZP22683.1 hypothetical protein K5K89_08135 [Pseudomonas sp. DR208]